MTPEIESIIAHVAIVVTAITPVARALMRLAHVSQRYAMKSATKLDDTWAVRFVMVTESFCGCLAKLTKVLPRITIGREVEVRR